MATVASGISSYASINDLLNRFDLRPLAQLLSDTGVPLTQTQISASVSATAILQEASGILEAASVVGGRYTITLTQNDLQTIATSGTNTAQFLIGIVCAMAYAMIWERRPEWLGGDPERAGWRVKAAMEWLDKIRDGQWIFGTLEGQNAGVFNDVIETEQVIQQQQGIVFTARPLFGTRVKDIVGMNPPPQNHP